MKKKKLSFLSIISISVILLFFNLSMAIAENPGGSSDPQCSSGGPGSSGCSITISGDGSGGGFGGGFSASCSTNCTSGFYACCYTDWMWPFTHCTCKPGASGGGGITN